MSIAIFSNAFSDELITATELNRQPGKVLDKAYEHPITITRNDQSFALLRREDVAYLVKGVTQSKAVFEVLSVAFRLLLGQKIGYEHPYGWLSVFDADELQDFLIIFYQLVLQIVVIFISRKEKMKPEIKRI
jgi:hypothetical protein